MTQPLEILEQMKAALDDAYAAGVRNTKREWVGLTEADFRELGFLTQPRWWPALEAKLKEKNT